MDFLTKWNKKYFFLVTKILQKRNKCYTKPKNEIQSIRK